MVTIVHRRLRKKEFRTIYIQKKNEYALVSCLYSIRVWTLNMVKTLQNMHKKRKQKKLQYSEESYKYKTHLDAQKPKVPLQPNKNITDDNNV